MTVKSTLRIAAVLLLCAAMGAGWARVKDVPWLPDAVAVANRIANDKQVEQQRQEIPDSVFISLDQFIELLDQRAAIIDAREQEAFEKEHLAVDYEPPVLNIDPEHDLEPHLDRLFQLAGMPIVLYCHSKTCPLAEELYLLLVDSGITANSTVSIFRPGWEAIEKTDWPRTTGPDEWYGFGATAPEDEGGDHEFAEDIDDQEDG